MKNSVIVKISTFATLFVFLAGACNKNEQTPYYCVPQTSTEKTTADAYLPSNGELIAHFNFSQPVNSYPDTTCGQTSYGSTSLIITSATNKTITFSYLIMVTTGTVKWQYVNSATIGENSTINVGLIAAVYQRLHTGTISILLYNVTIL